MSQVISIIQYDFSLIQAIRNAVCDCMKSIKRFELLCIFNQAAEVYVMYLVMLLYLLSYLVILFHSTEKYSWI